MKDSFIFYRSFLEGIEELSDKDKLKVLLAIAEYALNDKEPKLNGMSKMAYTFIKPQLDANKQRYENGKKGGRPKTKPMVSENKTDGFENTKPMVSENKTDGYVEKKPNVNVNENVNVNDNVNENEKPALAPVQPVRFPIGQYQNVFLSNDESARLVKEYGEQLIKDTIERLSEYMATNVTKYRKDGHEAVIRKWIREDANKKQETKAKKDGELGRTYTDAEYLEMERKKLGLI